MKNLIYMRQGHLDELRHHIKSNIHFYTENEPWLDKFFKEGSWFLSSKIKYKEFELTYNPDNSEADEDLEKVKIVYDALKDLTLTQASDERLWAVLTHSVYWKYMRQRWPLEKREREKPDQFLRERYFLITNKSRALVRNGIARLWWYGYASYDDARTDPFELTEILLKTTDVAASLTERAFSHNKNLSIAILSILKELDSSGSPFLKREGFRDLMKYINQTGGLTILDALPKDQLTEIMKKKIYSLLEKAA